MSEASVLAEIIRREGRSLLQYISEAFPWTTANEQNALNQLQMLIAEERDAVAGLSNFLAKRRIAPPYLGAYPMTFTNINYASLEYILPRLVTYQRQAVARLEQDLRQIVDPAAREQVEKILAMKRDHLLKLEELARSVTKPETAASTIT